MKHPKTKRSMRGRTLVLLLTILSLTQVAPAQVEPPVANPPAKHTPAPTDVNTLDGIIAALYGSISGGKDVRRDWDRFRGLFHENARMTALTPRRNGTVVCGSFSPQEYIDKSGPFLLANGFHEKEVDRQQQTFHKLVHVWSTYEGRHDPKDEKPLVKGINSIQAYHDGSRWWILHISWCPEDLAHPVPAEFDRNKK
jgi:hypothetical protein